MKTLPIEKIWTGDGFASNPVLLKQIKRNETVAIYERWHNEGKLFNGYEVFIIKKRLKGQPLPGGMTEKEDREQYPTANAFGKIAFHIRSLKLAEQKFEELTKRGDLDETDEDEVIFSIPATEFTCSEFATQNKINYNKATLLIKASIEEGKIKLAREEQRGAGKKTKIYSKI